MQGYEPGFEARVVPDSVRFTFPEYLLKAALDASYAAKDHNHDANYAAVVHRHNSSEIDGLDEVLQGLDVKYAPITHRHLIDHIDGLVGALEGKADTTALTVLQTMVDEKFDKSGGSITGNVSAPSFTFSSAAGTCQITGGTGDGASYSVYNMKIRSHWGIGFETYNGSINGYYDARSGKWDTKGGFFRDGVSVLYEGGRAYPRRVGGGNLNFHWSGQGGQPTWVWGGTEPGTDMYVYNPSNFNVARVGGYNVNDLFYQMDIRDNNHVKLNRSWQTIGAGAGAGGDQEALYISLNSYGNAVVIQDRGAGARGTIRLNPSGSVSYNTSSDYRLKPSVEPLVTFGLTSEQFQVLDNALLRVMAWRPVRHNWEATPDEFTHGFIAHELQEVSPYAVTGEKDGVEEIGTAVVLDEFQLETIHENVKQSQFPEAVSWVKTGERPLYQAVDPSKLVADLAASIQALTLMVLEQREQITDLKQSLH